jgi:hypothetical protein
LPPHSRSPTIPDMKSPEQVNQRLILSRQTYSGWAQGLSAGELKAPAAEYDEMIRKEIAILRGLALEHPLKVDTIKNLVERYEVLARHIRRQLP